MSYLIALEKMINEERHCGINWTCEEDEIFTMVLDMIKTLKGVDSNE